MNFFFESSSHLEGKEDLEEFRLHFQIEFALSSQGIDLDYLYRAAKYVQKAFTLFDEKTSVAPNSPSAFQTLVEAMDDFNQKARSELSAQDESGRCE